MDIGQENNYRKEQLKKYSDEVGQGSREVGQHISELGHDSIELAQDFVGKEGEGDDESIKDENREEGEPRNVLAESITSQEKMKLKRMTSRRQTRIQKPKYSLTIEEEEEPDFLKEMKELADDKLTAQDLLTQQGNTYSERDQRAKWADGKEATPPPPSGGVKITENKYWVPKTINPLEIELRKYQMKELKDAFDFLEDPKTGMVHVNDVATIVRACGFEPKHGEVSDILDKVNPYYPGNLSFDEFALVFKYKLDQNDPIQEIERAFKLMDLSKTGKVTLEDLKRVSQLVDYEVNDEELKQMIDEAFPSPDGDATIKGFVNLMTRKHYFDDPNLGHTHKRASAPEKKKFKKSYRTSYLNIPTLQG